MTGEPAPQPSRPPALPASELYARRASLAESALEDLYADLDRWEDQGRVDAGAAADARGSIRRALAALAGDRDGEVLTWFVPARLREPADRPPGDVGGSPA